MTTCVSDAIGGALSVGHVPNWRQCDLIHFGVQVITALLFCG
jgi:hypothetical protein